MTGRELQGEKTHERTLETFAGTGATPTDGTRRATSRGARARESELFDADVPPDRLTVSGDTGTIERASLVVTDVSFDFDRGLLACGRFRVGGTGPDDATWLCNRPFENRSLSLSCPDREPEVGVEPGTAPKTARSPVVAVSLGPIDLGEYGDVSLVDVPADVSRECERVDRGRGRARRRDAVTALLRAVATLSEHAVE